MAFTPDLPWPKAAGDAVRSKDWNDLVSETKRLDTAKVERAGDAITGPLSVAGALAVGKPAAAAMFRFEVEGDVGINDGNLYLRVGDRNHGLGWYGNPRKLWGAVNVDGPVLWGNAGGALGTALSGVQKIALGWDYNGNISIGVPSTTLKVDIGDRIRLRQGPAGDAGMWLWQSGPAEDRAFVGMAGDNTVGMWGNKGASWSLQMDVTQGQIGVRTGPYVAYAMYLNAGPLGGGAALPYGLVITGGTNYGLYVAGRSYDYSLRSAARATNSINTTSPSYVDMPNMSMAISVPPNITPLFMISVNINGVQAQGSTTIAGYFRLLVDGGQQDMTRQEFNNSGWELRGVHMERLLSLGPGSHTITVQWATTSGTLMACLYGDTRQIMVIEL